ncbi:transcriptional regulator [Sporosarcina soli]|uniref:Transcriptional regulator n=1 Tax=Sporosarcina soli TaxID=334736 RepID=A0ABW0TP28_9BACL
MRVELMKSMNRHYVLEMMYISKDGTISKRRIEVLQVGEVSFRVYCYLRKSNRTFTIDNVLALVPVIPSERMVI